MISLLISAGFLAQHCLKRYYIVHSYRTRLMSREEQLVIVREQREKLIKELNLTYSKAFDRLAGLDLADRTLARLVQIAMNSRNAAIQIMEEEIETLLITSAPI